MDIPISTVARLVQGRSDERNKTDLANAMRDLMNQQVNAWPQVITTTDATVTTAWSDGLGPNSVADLWLVAVGATADGTKVAAIRRRAVFQRPGSGAVAALGSADVIGTDQKTDPSWTAGFALDAGTPGSIFAFVQGAVGATVTWRLSITGVVLPWT